MDFNLIHKHYTYVLKEKREKLKNNIKIKVGFFISQKQLWSSQSIYDELVKHKLFEPTIVAFPDRENTIDTNITTCKSCYTFFKNKNMNVIYGYDINNDCFLSYEDIKADIVFFDQPYPRLPENIRWPSIYKDTLVCYVPYGYKIANFYESHFNMELQNSCWAIFAESDWHKKQFCKYGPINGQNVIVSGYPKLDIFLNKTDPNTYWKFSLNKNCTKIKKIIWAPHWSINDNSNYSTFDINYNYFLALAKNNKNLSFIFKPHQRLKHHLVTSGFMTQEEVESYYKQWDELDNSYYYNDSDYFDIFKTSDVLITDCGSYLAEYLPTQKPVIHLINKKSNGYNEIGKQIIDTYYKAYDIKDIDTLIKDIVINGNDYLKEERISKINLVQPNKNGAGQYIVEYLNKQLGVL